VRGQARTSLDRGLGDVNDKNVARWLRGPDHVLGRGDKLDNRAVELVTLPAVSGLVCDLVPVEQLGDLVREVAHRALPAVAALDEGYKWVDVGTASAAAGDDCVFDDRNGLLTRGRALWSAIVKRVDLEGTTTHITLLERAEGAKHEGEREL
jgi:hypothetical protein